MTAQLKHNLWQISAIVPAEAEDAVTELFSATLSAPCASYHDLETGQTTVSAFMKNVRPFAKAKVQLTQGFQRIRHCGLLKRIPRIPCKRLKREDWAESWKRHFKPLEVSRRLLIKPSWSHRKPKKGQAIAILDPGLSFGTGNHPTTGYCLEELARAIEQGPMGSFLDAGTGSGILAISAAKLGFSPIDAFDFDSAALETSIANAKRNRVEKKIHFFKQDATKFQSRRKYQVICANLSTEILEKTIARWATHLNRNGVLVLAGILKTEFNAILQVANKAGFRLLRRHNENEWTSGTFSF